MPGGSLDIQMQCLTWPSCWIEREDVQNKPVWVELLEKVLPPDVYQYTASNDGTSTGISEALILKILIFFFEN